MPSCRNCETNLGQSDNFCSNCATPQNEEASRRLSEHIDRRARQTSGGGGSGSRDGTLRNRLQYALGYLGVVAGLATLTDLAGVFFFIAGVFVLPPVQAAIESRLGRPIGVRPTAVATAALFVIGAAAFAVV